MESGLDERTIEYADGSIGVCNPNVAMGTDPIRVLEEGLAQQ